MRVIGIQVRDQHHGEFVAEALQTAAMYKRVTLEDLAIVTKESDGTVKIHQTKDITPKKGAVRGGLVGVVIGLAAPPLLGAAAVGAGLGALWGRLRDKGVDDDTMKKFVEPLEAGQAVVFALGDDASIAAIEDKVQELSDGKAHIVTFDPDGEEELRAAAQDMPLPGRMITTSGPIMLPDQTHGA